ncbi:MAG: hypothetical protein AAGG48_17215 [Planctomycetota bacterium]
MDSNYQKFIWTTIKDHCFTSFVAFTVMAVLMAVLMQFHPMWTIGFMGCCLFGTVFGMAWNTARYIESIIQIDLDEQSGG